MVKLPKFTLSKEKLQDYATPRNLTIAAAAIIFFALLVTCILSISPSGFSGHEIVRVEKNMYVSQAADLLKERQIIKSTFLLKVYIVLTSGGHRQIKAGDYLFDEPESAIRVAWRLTQGSFGLPKIKLTLYEGMTVQTMANAVKRVAPRFDSKKFMSIAKPFEGYLMPDTYFITEGTQPEELLSMLRDEFDNRFSNAKDDNKAGLTKLKATDKDIVTMASIVEMEATSSRDRRMIAGVLWKRLEQGMPLQVDATMYYFLGKPSSEITLTDLTKDSPYNSYKYKGLPPTPINNPGLSAIIDTMNPTASKFLFFLAGSDGAVHYAVNFDQHIQNKYRYIK